MAQRMHRSAGSELMKLIENNANQADAAMDRLFKKLFPRVRIPKNNWERNQRIVDRAGSAHLREY